MRGKILIAACLMGIATTAQAKDYITLGMNEAKTPEDVFAVIGYPDRKEAFGDNTVYYWTPQTVSYAVPCVVKVVANKDNAIVNWQVDGSDAGCQGITNAYRETIKLRDSAVKLGR
jgi:hypothetical protein